MTAISKLRFSYLGLLRLLPNRFNGLVLAENEVLTKESPAHAYGADEILNLSRLAA
jgi:hypothetical protein